LDKEFCSLLSNTTSNWDCDIAKGLAPAFKLQAPGFVCARYQLTGKFDCSGKMRS
jgi:hypothetical protein